MNAVKRLARISLVWLCLSPVLTQADFDIAAELYRQNNYIAAFDAFTKLSDQGDARAQTVLALMYKFGEGTPQDIEKAFALYATAAGNGYAAAQFHTGNMYAQGLGTDKNEELAILWLQRAARQGFSRAIDKLQEFETEIAFNNRDSAEPVKWNTNWDFRLPNTIRMQAPSQPLHDKLYQVQVGAMQTRSSATRLWKILKENHADLFINMEPRYILSENSKRRVYRIQTGPFANLRDASVFCEKLLIHPVQAGCMPIKNK